MDADGLLRALGRRARALRAERGLTLGRLATRSGLSMRFLGQVEQGAGNISMRSLAALCAALGTTPAELLAHAAPQHSSMPVVALLGLRGAGKTTIGRKLARRMRVPFVELDRRIEEAAGLTLGEVFAIHGESYYRRLEAGALDHVLSEDRPAVLATGGGIVTTPATFARLRGRALTVWLRAHPEDHWNRVVQQGDRRPMADNPEAMGELRRLLAGREPLYSQAAHVVDTSRLGVDGAVDAIESIVLARSSVPGRARVRASGRSGPASARPARKPSLRAGAGPARRGAAPRRRSAPR
jgi:XRE family aerobic/anaerobic benzoate catabolism transcriptional regulator